MKEKDTLAIFNFCLTYYNSEIIVHYINFNVVIALAGYQPPPPPPPTLRELAKPLNIKRSSYVRQHLSLCR